MNDERRSLMERPEVRAGDDGTRQLVGYAAVFNSPADIGGSFREIIAPGAFRDAISGDDVRALVDHDTGRVIGRKSKGTLRLSEDARGLRVEIDLPDTTDGRDLAVLVDRGDIDGMSFGFIVRHDEWDETANPPTRTIHAVTLREVSAVAFPAYADTTLGLRSLQSKRQHNFAAAAKRLAMKADLDLRARAAGSKA